MENDLQDIISAAAAMAMLTQARKGLRTADHPADVAVYQGQKRVRNSCPGFFVEAFFSLKSYRGEGAFLHWLNKIATRVGYRFWKQQSKAKIFVEVEDFDNIELRGETEQSTPPRRRKALHKLLEKLQPDDESC
jgi:hypothetical protein